jgi:hypothetical protein
LRLFCALLAHNCYTDRWDVILAFGVSMSRLQTNPHRKEHVDMSRKSVLTIAAGCLALGTLTLGTLTPGTPARAAGGVDAGVLTCHVSSGWGFVFGSSKNLNCVYSGGGRSEHYTGEISKFGVDIGYTQSGVIVWGVVAPTTSLAPGALNGEYGGVTGGASVGVGADANVLVGGSARSISLQPLSLEGNKGLNLAAGIGEITLRYQS